MFSGFSKAFSGCLRHKFKRVMRDFRGCLSHDMIFLGFFVELFLRCPGHKFKHVTGGFQGCLSHGMTFSVSSSAFSGWPGHKSKLVTGDSGLLQGIYRVPRAQV